MNLERVAALVASDVKPSAIATIVGTSPGRISQLMSDPAFLLIVESKRVEVVKKDAEEVALSAKYLEAEHLLLRQIMDQTSSAEFRDSVMALKVISERQVAIKKTVAPNIGSITNNTTILTLPSHTITNAMAAVTITTNREVIAIGEQSLAPLTSTAVTNLFHAMKSSKKGDNNEQITAITIENTSFTEVIPSIAVGTIPRKGEVESFWAASMDDIEAGIC